MKTMARMMVVAGMLVPQLAGAQSGLTVTERRDALQRSQAPTWAQSVNTGQHQLPHPNLNVLVLVSPDAKWLVVGQPVATGLDVETYTLFLAPVTGGPTILLAEVASGATFAPTSDSVFVSTGPQPVLFNLGTQTATAINGIESGIENDPVWVASWSADGKELVINRQQRFDKRADPRSWTVRLP